jgi:hypothetical protein
MIIEPCPDAQMDSATVQIVAYLLKRTADCYVHMNGKDALERAANILLEADRKCMS